MKFGSAAKCGNSMHNKYCYVIYPGQLWNTDVVTKEFTEGLGSEVKFQ